MKSSDMITKGFTSALRDARLFFSGCLSMHMVPVLFALVFIIVTNKKVPVAENTVRAKVVTHQRSANVSTSLVLNASNVTNAIAIYKASRLMMAAVSGK